MANLGPAYPTIDLKPSGALRADSAGAIVLTNGIQSTFRMEELNAGANWRWAGPFLWKGVSIWLS